MCTLRELIKPGQLFLRCSIILFIFMYFDTNTPSTIYLVLQADCDDSFQFIFFWVVKRDSIPDSIEVSHSSMILSELCQTEVDSTNEIHTHFLNSSMRFICKMLQIYPLCTFASSPPNLLSLCCWPFKELHQFL